LALPARRGRPKIDEEVRDLIRRLANENPAWGAPKIHRELQKLGFVVSERSVARYLVKFQLLHRFFVIERARRKILHFNVTRHPSADWVVQQLRAAFSGSGLPSACDLGARRKIR